MRLADCDQPLQQRFGTLLFDLDGVVYRGKQPVRHAVSAIEAARAHGDGVFFVTNNSARLPRDVADQLTGLGVAAEPDDVITSAQASADLLATWVSAGQLQPAARVLVVGAAGLRHAVAQAGFTPVESADQHPDVVVQGYNPDICWHDLAEAAYAIGAGARWLASNLDAALPTERGSAPGNGALVQAVAMATGATPDVAGKPERPLFDSALHATGADRADTLMIGDRLDSDIAGANTADLASLLVLTGVSGLADLFAAPAAHRPSYVAFDLDGLDQPQPPVRVRGDYVGCEDWTVELTDTPALKGHGSPIAALRAATAASWHYHDHASAGRWDPDGLIATLHGLGSDDR